MATRTKEFVVALENRPGTLAELTRALASANVNITAIDCEGLGDFGTARLLTNDVGKTETTLKGKGFKYRTIEVLTVHVPNRAGTLADITEKLAKSNVNIEGVFGTGGTGGEGELIFKVSDLSSAEKIIGV